MHSLPEAGWDVGIVPERQLGVSAMSAARTWSSSAAEPRTSPPDRPGGSPVTGVDITSAQLATARHCQQCYGIFFSLIEADAGAVPLPPGSFDLAVPECGASLCGPDTVT